MDRHLAALVALIRNARVEAHTADEITLDAVASAPVRDALTTLAEESSPFDASIFVGGQRQFEGAPKLQEGQRLRVVVAGIGRRDNRLVMQNLDSLLSYQGNALQGRPPTDFFLVREDYAAGEEPRDAAVAGYVALPALLAFLREACDVELPLPGGQWAFVIVSGKRINLPIAYTAEALRTAPRPEQVAAAAEQVLSTPQKAEKRELFKRVLVRALQDLDENTRFTKLLTGFSGLIKSFEADRDHFLSEFAFEKLREQFERKRVDYLLKIDNAVSSLVGKVLAIPIGQAVVVSQLSPDEVKWFGNVALILGSFFFTVIGVLVFYSHLITLADLERDVQDEKNQAEAKYPALHSRVKESFDPVFKRARNARRIGWFACCFLVAGFLVSLAGFDRVPPWPGTIRGWLESIPAWFHVAVAWFASLFNE